MKRLTQATYIRYVLDMYYQNLSKPARRPPQNPYHRRFLEN